MPKYIDDMMKIIREIAGSHSEYTVFADWLNMFAISTRNACTLVQDETYRKYEKEYETVYSKYKAGDRFGDLSGLFLLELEREPRDVLGELFMVGGYGSKMGGQFFTPRSISALMAQLEYRAEWKDSDEIITIHEPTIGSGGMIIEMCNLMKQNDINYQKRVKVIGQDLDWRCIHMSYVQLSYLGINAVIAQGDTLADPYSPGRPFPPERLWRTPGNKGALI